MRLFLATFGDLASREARATLRLAPSPGAATKLRRNSLIAALRRGGRSRGIQDTADKILHGLKCTQLRQPAQVEAAMALQARALTRSLDTIVDNIIALEGRAHHGLRQSSRRAERRGHLGRGA